MSQAQDDTPLTALAVAGRLREVVSRLKRRLREEAYAGDITWPQLRAMAYLDRRGPATVTTLAKAEGVRSQSMGESLAALRATGLISGTPDPNDGRQTVLALTPAGLDALQAARAAGEDWLSRAMQTRLEPEELKELARGVELLKRLVDN